MYNCFDDATKVQNDFEENSTLSSVWSANLPKTCLGSHLGQQEI